MLGNTTKKSGFRFHSKYLSLFWEDLSFPKDLILDFKHPDLEFAKRRTRKESRDRIHKFHV